MDLDITFNEDPVLEAIEDFLVEDYTQTLLEMFMDDILDDYIATIDI